MITLTDVEFLAACLNLTFEKPFDFERLRRTLRRSVEIAQQTAAA